MKIKKPIKVAAPAAAPAAPGGATIADRFKLENVAQEAAAGARVNKTAALVALICAVVGLGIAGMLTFTLYQHWEFLMPT